MIDRIDALYKLRKMIEQFPVTAILGSRQCGKTTLARSMKGDHYFDLENPRDQELLSHPQLALESLKGLIVIDEIQRIPELFPLLRFLVDSKKDQRYLILGSASRDLISQSSETLAGRIGYLYLDGFSISETGAENWRTLLLRGGYPRSFLAGNDEQSYEWRQQYITTFLERDVPALGISIPSLTLRRFWIMLSHYHGQTLNYTELARSFGISDTTVKRYIDILCGTFMVRLLMPWHTNISKRLVKAPKLYIRDSGIFHTLQSIVSQSDLSTNPKRGASWEGFALEETIRMLDKSENEVFFYATHSGAEIDLFWMDHGKNFGAEFKFSDAPSITRSMTACVKDLALEKLFVIYPGDRKYLLSDKIEVVPLETSSDVFHRIR